MKPFRAITFILFNLLASIAFAGNGIHISDAWVRATAPGQTVAAAYMTLRSPTATTLVKVESPAAASVEIHSMSMQHGIMKMRMLDTLPLAAGQTAKLAPGGLHLMLFDLKRPLQAGQTVQLTLHFRDGAGKTGSSKVSAPVRAGQN